MSTVKLNTRPQAFQPGNPGKRKGAKTRTPRAGAIHRISEKALFSYLQRVREHEHELPFSEHTRIMKKLIPYFVHSRHTVFEQLGKLRLTELTFSEGQKLNAFLIKAIESLINHQTTQFIKPFITGLIPTAGTEVGNTLLGNFFTALRKKQGP